MTRYLAFFRLRLAKRLRSCLVLLCLVALPAPAAIDVAEVPGKLNLGPHIAVLEDPGSELDIDALLTRGDGLPWQPSEQDVLNFSFSSSAWWLQFELTNTSSEQERRFLELAMPLHDYLDAWVVDAKGEVIHEWQTGDQRVFDSRPIAHRTFVMTMSLPPGETRRVILRLDTHDGLFDATPLYLMDGASFLSKSQRELMTFSLYFGALLALLIYNLLLYVVTRERPLLLYVLYLSVFFVLMFSARGFAFQYWWPNWPTFNNQMIPLNIGVFAVTLAIFSNSYLDLGRHTPRLARGLVGLAGLCVLSALPALLGYYAPVFRLMIPAAIVLCGLLFGVAVWRSWHRDILARIYLVAWSVLLIGVTLYFLRVAGLLPYNVVTEYAVQAGSGIEFLLLALGLAWKINQLKNDKLVAERAIHVMQRSLNQQLEAQVHERTRQLELANRQLEVVSRTDPLTGLLNRRQFEAFVDEEINRRRRHGRELLFAVMDIDDFKAYNDTYGHRAGDAVLESVAALLKTHFGRAGDWLFRLGGEEFGLMLESDTRAEGQAALERFRGALEGLGIKHRGSSHGVVTASFGLAACADLAQVTDAQILYQHADRAMYEAKKSHRNRVVTHTLHETT